MKLWLYRWATALLARIRRKFAPPPDYRAENLFLRQKIAELTPDEESALSSYMVLAGDLIDARLMQGAGPGPVSPQLRLEASESLVRIKEAALGLRETAPISAMGAFGDIELALQNLEWRREINLSWLEFSRWGIQQIILISRLWYLRNPWIRRGVNLSAVYVYGRGVEITSDDDKANEVIEDFLERNKAVFGQNALVEAEKRKYYDGNLFWVFFADTQNTGEVNVRLIDATEIQEVITNPSDHSEPWFYKREWSEKVFDVTNGSIKAESKTAYYPALGYDPAQRPPTINNYPVNWDNPVYHRKVGHVAAWHFGCPIVYAALDWARVGSELLQACASMRKSLAQFVWKITTKGGQAALANLKTQLETTVNAQPGNSLWDTNPTATSASVFAAGPGTQLSAVSTAGAGGNPDDVKQFKINVANAFDIPPTWLGDMETSNLSTALTLDRPTELGFLMKQEACREDLTTIITFVLETSLGAASGKLKESRGEQVKQIVGAQRIYRNGKWSYAEAAKKPDTIKVRVLFPAIREGDLPALVKAVAEAMTLDNKGGQIVGIDEREGVRMLLEVLASNFDIEVDELLDQMYPDKGPDAYDPDRTKVPLPAPVQKALPSPGGDPQLPGGHPQAPQTAPPPVLAHQAEAFRRLMEAVSARQAK